MRSTSCHDTDLRSKEGGVGVQCRKFGGLSSFLSIVQGLEEKVENGSCISGSHLAYGHAVDGLPVVFEIPGDPHGRGD